MTRIIALALAALLLVAPQAFAQISGRVTVVEKGDVQRKVVENVLVYVAGVEGPISPEKLNRHVTITSENKEFQPHVEVVPVGESVTFPNVDDIMHNVFSISEGNRFDLGLYKSGARKEFVFENPGLVRIYCNIHPDMSAFLQVLPNEYYVWTKPDGTFSIPDVPPGRYTLNVWHEEGETSHPVIVSEGGASGVLVDLDVSDFKKRPHLNKFGKPYKRKRGKY